MATTAHQLVRDPAGNPREYGRLHREHEPFYRFHIELVAKVRSL